MGALIVLLVLPVDYHLNSPHLVNAVQLGGDSPLVVSQDIGLQLSQSLGELELVCVSEEEVADGGNSLGPGSVTTGINDIDDALGHLLLADSTPCDYAGGVVPVHPNLRDALLVDSDVVLFHLKAAVFFGQCAEAR